MNIISSKSLVLGLAISITITSIISSLFFASEATAVESSAKYKVTFQSTWSAKTHSAKFPSNPHFSGLIGANHNSSVELWSRGGMASKGIESMSETGSKRNLTREINRLLKSGDAGQRISGGGIANSPGSVVKTFRVTTEHSLVSLVSMIAPSPDWFIGVSSLNLLEDGEWVESKVVGLAVYDAGTDSGRSYRSGDINTRPPERISRLTTEGRDSDFRDGQPYVGTFTFVKQ